MALNSGEVLTVVGTMEVGRESSCIHLRHTKKKIKGYKRAIRSMYENILSIYGNIMSIYGNK